MKQLGSCLALLCLLAACNEGPPVKTVRQPDGSWRLTCKASLVSCADRAEALCKDRGLTLLSGRSEHKLYGHETGASQVEARSSELLIKCVERKGGSPDAIAEAPVLQRAEPLDPPATACVPGTTQRCVGPGACNGGQVCLSNGAAFGACDCGSAANAPVSAPLGAPASPAPAAPAPAAPAPSP